MKRFAPFTIIRSIVGTALIALCFLLLNLSLTISKSNTHYYRALSNLSSQAHESPTLPNLLNAKYYIEQALALFPYDPNILTAAGRTDYLLAITENQHEERQRLLDSSKRFHLEALKQRPYWAYSEINLLFTKGASNEYDSQFQKGFANAIRLAPENRLAIKDLTELSIRDWDELSRENQQKALSLIETSLKHNLISEKPMAALMRQHRSFYQICAQLKQFAEKRELCNPDKS